MGINQEINEVTRKAGMTVAEMMKIVDEASTDCEKHPDDVEVEEWLATRKREALKIDPETAEVTWGGQPQPP
jgi:hypothetical protein